MKTLEQFINDFHNALITDNTSRSNGQSFIKLKDGVENYEDYRNIIRSAHDGSLPSDAIFDCIYSILGNMVSCGLEDCTDLYDLEIDTDFEVSRFTDVPYLSYYMDRAFEEYSPQNYSSLLANAQLCLIDEVKSSLLDSIRDLEGIEWDYADNIENEEE